LSQNNQQEVDQAWYQRWFGREYLELYAHRDDDEASRDVDAIEQLLDLGHNQPILDLACGNGRHSIEIAKRGYQVTGIDLSKDLLRQARQKAAESEVDIPFLQFDMRDHPFFNEFGALINMFTSFGYFDNDAENARVMEAIARALRPDGRFYIDYINKLSVLENLVPQDEREVNGKNVVQKRIYKSDIERLEKEIIISDSEGERRFVESVRLYSAVEMEGLAEKAGLKIEHLLGSVAGEEFTDNSPRLILVGRKPG
jgi:SAM-dependent methyltransferase